MIEKLSVLALLLPLCLAESFSQTTTSSQNAGSGATIDCSDPFQAASPECSASQIQNAAGAQGPYSGSATQVPQLRNNFGSYEDQNAPRTTVLNPPQVHNPTSPAWPRTEFEQMAADSAGRPLPLFGQSLFEQSPSTFAPIDLLQIPDDYMIGPGDQLQIRVWGQLQADLRVTVDRSGQIYIPRVGQVSVAGVHYADLGQVLRNEISKIFKNFNLTVNVGRLRSMQVLILGNARYPGTYTISSLSSLVNAVFTSGGPTPQGSLRDIQVRRDGKTITDFDFYDLLIKGDKSKDVHLQPGDVLYIPPVGALAAISGSVNTPAIYELKGNSTLNDLVDIAGGMSSLADTGRITIERLVDHQSRKTLEFPYDDGSRATALQDGDIVRVFSIVPSFQDTVTLRGNVANPGRYPWKAGMRIRDLIPSGEALLTRRYWLERAMIGNGLATEYPVGPRRQRIVRCLPNGSSPAGTQQTAANIAAGSQAATPTENDASAAGAPDSSGVVYVPCAPRQQVPSDTASANASDRMPLGNRETAEM